MKCVISIILPSYLGQYPRAARNREAKLVRAIESVIKQTYTTWELIIISDGCNKTVQIVTDFLKTQPPEIVGKIHGYQIKKCKAWSGTPRNTGLQYATGVIICYLDSDDTFGNNHLQFIADSIKQNEWIWFDDKIFRGNVWHDNKCKITHRGDCGTSNIAHLRKLNVRWPDVSGYAMDDWNIIKSLRNFKGEYAGQGFYHTCHIPGKCDV